MQFAFMEKKTFVWMNLNYQKSKHDEILVKIISDSVCMSTYKLVQQGNNHKRVSKDLAENPAVIGHELSGIIMKAGKKWKDLYPIGMKFTVQPEVTIHGESRKTVGYNYPMYGGDSTYSILPAEIMETNSLIPFHGDSFFEASLSEPPPVSLQVITECITLPKKNHEHIMGVKEDGNLIIFGACGPDGIRMHRLLRLQIKPAPKLIVAVDVSDDRLERAKKVLGNSAEAQYVVWYS